MKSIILSHGMQMGDALIAAATALDHGLPVLTGNVKPFGAVEGLTFAAFCPTRPWRRLNTCDHTPFKCRMLGLTQKTQ